MHYTLLKIQMILQSHRVGQAYQGRIHKKSKPKQKYLSIKCHLLYNNDDDDD